MRAYCPNIYSAFLSLPPYHWVAVGKAWAFQTIHTIQELEKRGRIESCAKGVKLGYKSSFHPLFCNLQWPLLQFLPFWYDLGVVCLLVFVHFPALLRALTAAVVFPQFLKSLEQGWFFFLLSRHRILPFWRWLRFISKLALQVPLGCITVGPR